MHDDSLEKYIVKQHTTTTTQILNVAKYRKRPQNINSSTDGVLLHLCYLNKLV